MGLEFLAILIGTRLGLALISVKLIRDVTMHVLVSLRLGLGSLWVIEIDRVGPSEAFPVKVTAGADGASGG